MGHQYVAKSERDSILEDDMFDDEQRLDLKESIPVLENGWGSYGDYRLVGNGVITNANCGKVVTLKGCLRAELHGFTTLEGVNYAGKVFVRRVRFSCGKPSCPVCFKSGWAVRQAGRAEVRLAEASKRFGLPEHIIVSVPAKDYGLGSRTLRRKVIKMLRGIGVVGGCFIWHGFRYSLRKGWYFSPHYHIIGFILGGYSRCRHCKGADCYSCNGFEGKLYKLFHKNGYIVKVMGRRVTVFGTVWYQLSHASYEAGVKRYHILTWFGNCSYRKLKVTAEVRKDVCPICQHDLVKLRYFGSKRLNLSKERDSFEDLVEDGRVVFVEKVSRWAGARKNLITDDDYFHFPSGLGLRSERLSADEEKAWRDYEASFEKVVLPKRQIV